MKILITITMILIWAWTIFMGVFATNVNGRIAGWGIGLLINIILALCYSYLDKRPRTVREWFKM